MSVLCRFGSLNYCSSFLSDFIKNGLNFTRIRYVHRILLSDRSVLDIFFVGLAYFLVLQFCLDIGYWRLFSWIQNLWEFCFILYFLYTFIFLFYFSNFLRFRLLKAISVNTDYLRDSFSWYFIVVNLLFLLLRLL